MLLSSKVRLNDFKRSAMVSLTTVIPVASTITNVSNLDRNISNALANNIQVILVIDQVSETTNAQLEKIQEKYNQESNAFELKRGHFGSPGKARNEGLQYVETEFITFWDADDLVNVEELARVLSVYGENFDYIVGSYEIRKPKYVVSQRVSAVQPFPRLRVVHQPGVWRIVFRKSQVQKCIFGTSRMGEDQIYLANSGLFNSSRVFFSDVVFYTYFIGVEGQLTNSKEMNSALRVSILELLRTIYISDLRELVIKCLIVLRLYISLIKRLMFGKR